MRAFPPSDRRDIAKFRAHPSRRRSPELGRTIDGIRLTVSRADKKLFLD
jgi:hypothetical protein